MILNFHVFTSLVHSSVRHSPSRVGVAIKVRTTWRFAQPILRPLALLRIDAGPESMGWGIILSFWVWE